MPACQDEGDRFHGSWQLGRMAMVVVVVVAK